MNIITKIKEIIKKIDKYDICIFFLIFLSFFIVLSILYPGILTYDSYNQLYQIEINQFNDWHPFLYTLFEKFCLTIRNNPSSIAIAQILIFAIIWTLVCKYNRKNTKSFIWQIVITILIILNPLNPLYAITLWKDILYCYLILTACFLMQLAYDKRFVVSTKFLVSFCFVMALILKIRYNGVIVLFIVIPVFLYLLYKNDKKSRNYLKMPAYLTISIILISLLNPIFNVEIKQKDALSQKIVQYIGAFVQQDVLEKNDEKFIQQFVDTSKLEKYYNPYYADTIYECDFNEDVYILNKKEVYRIVIKYTILYPNIFLDFALKSTSLIWQVPKPKDNVGTEIETGVFASNNYMNLVPKNYDKEFYKRFQSFLQLTKNNKFLNTILYNSALYFYISIIILLVLALKYKKNYIIIALPSFANIISTIPSLPVQDTRYLYNNFLLGYLLLIVLGFYFFKKNNPKIRRDSF